MSLCFHKEKSVMSLEEMKAVLSLHPGSEVKALSKHSECLLLCCKAAAFSAQPCRCLPAPQRITRLFPPLSCEGRWKNPEPTASHQKAPACVEAVPNNSRKTMEAEKSFHLHPQVGRLFPPLLFFWRHVPPRLAELSSLPTLLRLFPHSHQCLQNPEYNRESDLPLFNCFAFNNPYPCLCPIFRFESFRFLPSS